MLLPDLMYDAIHAENIPANAKLVAGYVNGKWPSYFGYTFTDSGGVKRRSPSVRERCPDAVAFSIAVSADADADILDIERFDATPEQAPGWVLRQRQHGNPAATVYCNTSTYPAVRAAFSSRGIAQPPWWAANYSLGPNLFPGSATTQYGGVVNSFDLSVVDSEWSLLKGRNVVTQPDFTSLDRSMLSQIFAQLPKIPTIALQNEQTQQLIQQLQTTVAHLAATVEALKPGTPGLPGELTLTLTGSAVPKSQ